MSNQYWATNWATASNAYQTTQFDRLGHPGRYFASKKHDSGQTYLTGSNYGYGAIMIGSGSSTTFGNDDKIVLSGGGEIKLQDFPGLAASDNSTLLELSVLYVSSSVGAPSIYFLKRQQ